MKLSTLLTSSMMRLKHTRPVNFTSQTGWWNSFITGSRSVQLSLLVQLSNPPGHTHYSSHPLLVKNHKINASHIPQKYFVPLLSHLWNCILDCSIEPIPPSLQASGAPASPPPSLLAIFSMPINPTELNPLTCSSQCYLLPPSYFPVLSLPCLLCSKEVPLSYCQ